MDYSDWAKDQEREFDFKNRIRLADLLHAVGNPSEPPTPLPSPTGINEKGDYLSIPNANEPAFNPLLNGVPLTKTMSKGIHFTDSGCPPPDDQPSSPSPVPSASAHDPLSAQVTLSLPTLDRSTSLRRRKLHNSGQQANARDETKPLALSIDPGPLLLPRILSVALFQRQNSGVGAPHTFVSFLKHCPGLPRVIVRPNLPCPMVALFGD